MKTKTFTATVGTRNRITVPLACFKAAKANSRQTALKLSISGKTKTWGSKVGKTPYASYRVAVPFCQGEKLNLTPSAQNHTIKITKKKA